MRIAGLTRFRRQESEPFGVLDHWRREWARVVLRPEDLRALRAQMTATVDGHWGESEEHLFWRSSTPGTASSGGARDIDSLVLVLQARSRFLDSLELAVVDTRGRTTLFEFLELPREPRRPGYRPPMRPPALHASVLRASALLATIRRERPALVLEALTEPPLLGDLALEELVPQIDRLGRRAPDSLSAGFLALCVGCLVPDCLLAEGSIGPALALVLVFALGLGARALTIRAMDWLFPVLELLPDDRAETRWQQTRRIAGTLGTILVGAAGVFALVLTLAGG